MLMPKRTKYRRVQRGRMKGAASRGNKVSYGEFGIQALEPGWITGNQIEAARVAMTRYTKRGGQVWIKIFPDKPVSKKALGVRMGSGKGAPEYWVAVVKNQKVMFEIGGVSEAEAREAECQRRRDESRDHDGQHGDDHAVEEIDIELFLAEDVHVVFNCDRVQRGEELRRELIERTVRL